MHTCLFMMLPAGILEVVSGRQLVHKFFVWDIDEIQTSKEWGCRASTSAKIHI